MGGRFSGGSGTFTILRQFRDPATFTVLPKNQTATFTVLPGTSTFKICFSALCAPPPASFSHTPIRFSLSHDAPPDPTSLNSVPALPMALSAPLSCLSWPAWPGRSPTLKRQGGAVGPGAGTFTVLRKFCSRCTFTVLRQKPLTFTEPPPYDGRSAAASAAVHTAACVSYVQFGQRKVPLTMRFVVPSRCEAFCIPRLSLTIDA